MSPLSIKITTLLKMKTDSFAWHLFQTARTYLIYAVGATLFSVGISEAIHRFNDALKVFYIKDYANPWIFFDQSILNFGVTWGDINIIIVCVILLVVVAVLREKNVYARIWIKNQSFLFDGLYGLVYLY